MRIQNRVSNVRRVLLPAIILLLTCLHADVARSQSAYHLTVGTNTGNDTMMVGVEGSLIFGVDSSAGVPVTAFTWTLEFDYSNGNVIGPISDFGPDSNVTFVRPPIFWAKAVRKKSWTRSTDTLVVGTFYFVSPFWTGTGEQWRITFTPSDTGHLTIDSAWSPPANRFSIVAADASDFPVSWTPKTITFVAYCPTGDSNEDSVITAADIIYLVNYVFKGGPEPVPCVALGDVNCSGTVTSADIVGLVAYIFRGGVRPCYSCGLVEQGIWTCP